MSEARHIQHMLERRARVGQDEDVIAPQVTIERGVGSVAGDGGFVNEVTASIKRRPIPPAARQQRGAREASKVTHMKDRASKDWGDRNLSIMVGRRVRGCAVEVMRAGVKRCCDASRRGAPMIYRSAKRVTAAENRKGCSGKEQGAALM